MWPSDIEPSLRDEPFRARALALARAVYREDTLEFDFDMVRAVDGNPEGTRECVVSSSR